MPATEAERPTAPPQQFATIAVAGMARSYKRSFRHFATGLGRNLSYRP